jgi:hypothetical protein
MSEPDDVFAELRKRYPQPDDLDTAYLRPREVERFRQVINEDQTESAIDNVLRGYPDLWSAFLHLNNTGYQGGRVLSQQVIRPAVRGVQPGLIPDYLIAGRNSDGMNWWVVELKGANEQVFTGTGNTLRLSETANKAILQLLKYLDFCTEHQAALRDAFKLNDFREPRGVLLIGRQREFDESDERQRMKRIWNRSNHLLEIRSYDSFLRCLDHKLYLHGFRKEDPPPLPGDADIEMR